MCYELCAILYEYYQERIMVRLFVSLIVAGFYSCNDLFRLFVSFFVVLIKRRYATNTATRTATRTAKKATGLDKRKNNNFARASRFFVHFSAVKCLPPLAWSKDHKIWFFKVNGQFICSTPLGQISRLPRTGTKDNNFLLWCSPLEFNSKRICQHLTN